MSPNNMYETSVADNNPYFDPFKILPIIILVLLKESSFLSSNEFRLVFLISAQDLGVRVDADAKFDV